MLHPSHKGAPDQIPSGIVIPNQERESGKKVGEYRIDHGNSEDHVMTEEVHSQHP